MENRAFKILEYDKIINMLKTFCMSEPGVHMAEASKPSNNYLFVRKLQDQTAEAHSYMQRHSLCPIRGFSDIKEDIKRANISGMLTAGRLLAVADFLQISRVVKKALSDDKDGGEILKVLSDHLIINRHVEQEITRCILSEDENRDSASSTLYNIRRDIRKHTQKIRSKL